MDSVLRKSLLLPAIIFAFNVCAAAQVNFDSCLDKAVNKEDFVIGSSKITIKEKLAAIKARCRRGKLVDRKRREIKFFKAECWGNPPADYLEIQQKQQLELAQLKKKYTVIEIACAANLMMPDSVGDVGPPQVLLHTDGRMATRLAYEHFGLEQFLRNDSAPSLFK